MSQRGITSWLDSGIYWQEVFELVLVFRAARERKDKGWNEAVYDTITISSLCFSLRLIIFLVFSLIFSFLPKSSLRHYKFAISEPQAHFLKYIKIRINLFIRDFARLCGPIMRWIRSICYSCYVPNLTLVGICKFFLAVFSSPLILLSRKLVILLSID